MDGMYKNHDFKKNNKIFRPIISFLYLSYLYMYYEDDRIKYT